jgi:ferredoxin
VFEQDDTDGRVVLLREHPEPGESDDVQEAADVCPVAAIKLHRR